MLTFIGGPAATEDKGLCIRRVPLYLRVVRSRSGEWDALDQLADELRPTETPYAYRCTAYSGWVCIRRARGGGRCAIATYEFVEPQPDRETMADNAKWREWTEAMHPAREPVTEPAPER